MIKKIWNWFWQPSKKFTWGAIFIIGGIAGIIFLGSFNSYVEYTNSEEFCISCHEMRDTVYEEYKKSSHYKNASGVRAICSDCHVPKKWTAKLIRKVQATSELYHKLVGTIDTLEKFEAKRFELARRVWESMKNSDSQECRNCHAEEAMDFTKQGRRASKKMQEAFEVGEKTCIECHQGVAHKLPVDPNADDED